MDQAATTTPENILAIVRGLPVETVAEIFLKVIAGRPAAGLKVECNSCAVVGGSAAVVDITCTAFDGYISTKYWETKTICYDPERLARRVCEGAVDLDASSSDRNASVHIGGLENAIAAAMEWTVGVINARTGELMEKTFLR